MPAKVTQEPTRPEPGPPALAWQKLRMDVLGIEYTKRTTEVEANVLIELAQQNNLRKAYYDGGRT